MTKHELKYGIRQILDNEEAGNNMMTLVLIEDLIAYDDRMDVKVVGDTEEDVTIGEYLRHIGIEQAEEATVTE
jgi:hypothetical protein